MEATTTKTEANEKIEARPEVNLMPQEQEEEKLLRLAVIGTGNCGCMMANDACERLGIDGVAINGSQKDLDLVNCPRVIKMTVADGRVPERTETVQSSSSSTIPGLRWIRSLSG